jgi:hypothetical protein
MNLSEIAIVLDEGRELLDEKMIFHVDIKTAILNAPHFYKRNQKPYLPNEFLPKNIVKALKKEVRPEDQARLIQERGDALAAKCRQYKTRK